MKAYKLNIAKRLEAELYTSVQKNVTSSVNLSLVIITLLEVVSVIVSVIVISWIIIPIYPQSHWPLVPPILLILILIVYSQMKRGESWADMGFSQRYFVTAIKLLLLPVGFGCGILLTVGYLTNSFHRTTHFGTNLLFVPLWGVVQQYVLQGFLYRRIRFLLFYHPSLFVKQIPLVWLAILLTAGLFAIMHLPNLTLALLTLTAAILWAWVYERAPNLWALGLSHGLLSLVLMHSIPLQCLHSMSVGYKHFLYYRF